MIRRRTPIKRSTKPIKRAAIKRARTTIKGVDWRIMPDGREVCSDAEYKQRTVIMAERQGHLCAICKRFLVQPTFDHEAGRGMNASKRDDRLTHDDGSWRNASVCWECNSDKGSRHFAWQDGIYREIG